MKHDSMNLTAPHTARGLAQADTDAGAMHAKQIATMISEDAYLDRGDIGKPTTGDLISREGAIAALLDHGFDSDDVALDILLALPAAQIGGAA